MKRLIGSLWSYSVLVGMSVVLLPLLILGGHGAGWAGLGYVSAVLPYVFFGLFAGRVGDRMNRRLLLTLALSLAGLACALLLIILGMGLPVLWILVCGFLLGSAQPFVDAAVFGALSGGPESRQRLSLAVAGGPAGRVLGSLLVALSLWLSDGRLAAGFMLLLACLSLLLCSSTPHGLMTGQAMSKSPRSWRELFSDQRLKQLILSGVLWNLLAVMLIGGASAALLELLLGVSSHQTALLLGLATGAAFLASMMTPWITAKLGPWRAILLSTGGSIVMAACFMTAVAFHTSLLVCSALFISTLFLNQVYITNLMVERQSLAPADSRSSVATASRLVTWLGACAGVGVQSWFITLWGAQAVGWLSWTGAFVVWLLMIRWWCNPAFNKSRHPNKIQ